MKQHSRENLLSIDTDHSVVVSVGWGVLMRVLLFLQRNRAECECVLAVNSPGTTPVGSVGENDVKLRDAEGISSLVAVRTDAPFTAENLYHLGFTRLGPLRDINDRPGVTQALETIPDVFLDEPLGTGHCDGVAINREECEEALGYVREKFEWKDGGLDHTGSVPALVTAARRAAGPIFEEVRL